jgi:hypothetical protein
MAAADPRVPYFQLLTSRTFIGCCAATFGAYWALSLGLTWFTPFIVQGLGFSQKDAGWVSVLPWLFGAVTVLTAGWVSQVMLARGFTTRGARGVLGSVPLIVGGLILATLSYAQPGGLMIALLVVGSGLCGAIYVVLPADARRVHPGVAARRRDRDLWRDLYPGGHDRAGGDGARGSRPPQRRWRAI